MEPTKKKARWTRSEKLLLTLSLAVTVIAGGGTIWWQAANVNPVLTIPTPTLPNPNAHDFYVAASKIRVHDREIGNAVQPRRRARRPNDRALTLADKQKLVRDNAETLRMLRQGFAYPYHEPPVRSLMHLFPHYAGFRNMARMLVLEGEVKEAQGDRKGAADSYLDVLHLGNEIPRGGVLISALVGYACKNIGHKRLWELADRLSAAEARMAARRMEKMRQRRVPFAETLQEEKWAAQAGMMEMFQRGNLGFAGATGQDRQGPQWLSFVSIQARVLLKGKRQIVRDHGAFMDQLIANARQPYSAHRPNPPVPNDPINRLFLPVFDQAYLKAVVTETQDALLMIVLALRAYRAEQGSYPTNLEALTPKYLPQVPTDPFALQGSFKYRRTGSKYLLYSVGPDGSDNGGKAIHNPARPGREKHRVEAGAKGDLVAGVNTY